MPDIATTEIKDTTANPGPLGLLAFGMTTVLLNLHNAGIIELSSMILAMGVFYGGTAQVIAGIMEWKKNNTFGTTAFISYGMFWLTLVGLIVMPKQWGVAPTGGDALVAYLVIWGVFTFGLFIGTLRLSRALQFVFATLVILFFLLAIGHHEVNHPSIDKYAGYEGIVCGLSAMYAGFAGVLNEVFGRTLLPIGPVKR